MNDYFEFKEFTIQQSDCAMKVCTDACIQGAWTVAQLSGEKNILDIGTGTGLLSLMLAQNSSANITAIEIDDKAANQAGENFNNSKWERITLIKTSLQKFSTIAKFDLIICNPPFYDNDLKSPDKLKNIAMHSAELSLEELMKSINLLFMPEGKASVMIPYDRLEEFSYLTRQHCFNINKTLLVKQTPAHSYFRAIIIFSKTKTEINVEELMIKENDEYTNAFITLLKPYYLKL